jgi:hypothetical protein
VLETSAGFLFCAAKKPFNAKTKLPTRNIRTSNRPHELQSDFQLVFRAGSFNQNEVFKCDSRHKGRDNVKVPLQKLQDLDAQASKYYGDWRPVKPNSSNKELRATYTLLIERLQEHYTHKMIDKEKMGIEEGKNAEREKKSARIYAATSPEEKAERGVRRTDGTTARNRTGRHAVAGEA